MHIDYLNVIKNNIVHLTMIYKVRVFFPQNNFNNLFHIGTAAVVVAGLFGAFRITGKKLSENTFLFVGAGQVRFSITIPFYSKVSIYLRLHVALLI
jgi:hypothetical protein